jgi:hypothetical protein
MSVPYFVRIFRQTDSPMERKRIYQKVGSKLKTRLRKRFNLCIHCFNAPISNNMNLCRSCASPARCANSRRERFQTSARCAQLQPHRRVCVGCGGVFVSEKGFNLCADCVQRTRAEAARRTLGRGATAIPTKPTVVMLYKKHGHRYKPSVTPRIPLSIVTVFEAVGGR